MTRYEELMNREHKSWCEYPREYCSCSPALYKKEELPMEDEEFEVAVLVRVRSIGLPQNHRSNIIDRIAREMHLAFKGNARIDEIEQSHESLAYGGPNVWVFPAPVVSQEVQRVHPKQEVSQVQGNWTTGGGT